MMKFISLQEKAFEILVERLIKAYNVPRLVACDAARKRIAELSRKELNATITRKEISK